jgi:hypothetical protein
MRVAQGIADTPYALLLGERMKNNGVFLGGLTSVLACNLMLIGVCSSAPAGPAPAAAPPPPAPPPPVVRMLPKPVEIPSEPVPLGLFFWGCGSHLSVDPDGVIALPICAPMRL